MHILDPRRTPVKTPSPGHSQAYISQVDFGSILATKPRHRVSLKPECSGFLQQRHQGTINMGRHDLIHGPDELPSYEDDRDRTIEQPRQGTLDLLSPWVEVQLVDCRVHSHTTEEPLHRMAHAAAPQAEYHHRALRRQTCHPLHRATVATAPGGRKPTGRETGKQGGGQPK